jgi:glycosyltransferase involved in cell wall biosynthesis
LLQIYDSTSHGAVIILKVMQIILNNQFYGAERVVYNLCKGLRSDGVNVVLVTSQALQAKFCETSPSALYALPNHEGTLLKRALAIPKEIYYLRQIISKERPDIIHFHGSLARIVMLAARSNQVVVETLHGEGRARGEALERFNRRLFDSIAALSFDGSIYYRNGIIGNYSRLRLLRPNAVIYNAVDVDFARLISRTTTSPVGGEYILWCSRLDAVKGTDLLLRAFATLDRPEIRLVLLGDGSQRRDLEGLAKSLHIDDRTMFLGFVDGAEKARFYQHASVVCAPVTSPELSQTLLEAVFSGNRVIACYDSEVEQVFGDNVALLKEPSVSKLATMLSEILEKKQGRNQPVTLDASLEKRFSLGYFTRQYLAFYSLVKSGSSH